MDSTCVVLESYSRSLGLLYNDSVSHDVIYDDLIGAGALYRCLGVGGASIIMPRGVGEFTESLYQLSVYHHHDCLSLVDCVPMMIIVLTISTKTQEPSPRSALVSFKLGGRKF